jgi:excisionase family DNA binding protein
VIFSIEEAATYLQLNPQTVRSMAAGNRLPAGKVGRAWRFHKDDLDSFLRSQYTKVINESDEPKHD